LEKLEQNALEGDSMTGFPSSPRSLPPELLTKLLGEIDDDSVTTIILHGSYARGDAVPPYSDVDLVRITKETPDRAQQKRFFWYDGYLLNLSSRPLSIYKEWLTMPQEAIYRVSTIRDAHILLEKDGSFRAFQQEVLNHWKWEPLQSAANAYAGRLLAELSEVILRTIGAIRFRKTVMLVERICLHILPAVTEAVGVQQGILATGNNYLYQVQETVGRDSSWTHFYLEAAGVSDHEDTPRSLERRGLAALRLYQETIYLLRPHLVLEHMETIDPLLFMIDECVKEEFL
jgi:predicted nucleotidyltransferase